MIYCETEKNWLIENGYWDKVKYYTKNDSDYADNPKEYGFLSLSFDWLYTEEGRDYWSDVYDEMERQLNTIIESE